MHMQQDVGGSGICLEKRNYAQWNYRQKKNAT